MWLKFLVLDEFSGDRYDGITLIWLGPSFGMVLGPFDDLFNFVAGGCIIPVAARHPARDTVPVGTRTASPPPVSSELLAVLDQVSQYGQGQSTGSKAKADQPKDTVAAREARAAKLRVDENRRRERSPARPNSPSSAEPPLKKRPSGLLLNFFFKFFLRCSFWV